MEVFVSDIVDEYNDLTRISSTKSGSETSNISKASIDGKNDINGLVVSLSPIIGHEAIGDMPSVGGSF